MEWSEADTKIFLDVQNFGWHVLKVADQPPLAYTIGLYARFKQPELIVFGMALEDLHTVCNLYGAAVRDGLTPPEDMVVGRKTVLRRVSDSDREQRMGTAHWFYRNQTFPAVQLFWSDTEGRFPWEEGCQLAVRQAQPMV